MGAFQPRACPCSAWRPLFLTCCEKVVVGESSFSDQRAAGQHGPPGCNAVIRGTASLDLDRSTPTVPPILSVWENRFPRGVRPDRDKMSRLGRKSCMSGPAGCAQTTITGTFTHKEHPASAAFVPACVSRGSAGRVSQVRLIPMETTCRFIMFSRPGPIGLLEFLTSIRDNTFCNAPERGAAGRLYRREAFPWDCGWCGLFFSSFQ